MTGKAGRVAGKQALITGAAGGLGEAMAWMLAREGAKVAVTDVNLAGAHVGRNGWPGRRRHDGFLCCQRAPGVRPAQVPWRTRRTRRPAPSWEK